MDDVNITSEHAMRQAGMTAEYYLVSASNILNNLHHKNWKLQDAIELSKVMATDFNTALMCMKMQEIRDVLYKISDKTDWPYL